MKLTKPPKKQSLVTQNYNNFLKQNAHLKVHAKRFNQYLQSTAGDEP